MSDKLRFKDGRYNIETLDLSPGRGPFGRAANAAAESEWRRGRPAFEAQARADRGQYDQAHANVENASAAQDHARGGPKSRVEYDARRKAVRERLKRLHRNRDMATWE